MTDTAVTAPKLRTLEDLADAIVEGGGSRCDRCRREAGTLRVSALLRAPRVGKRGLAAAAAKVDGLVCEGCGVEILAVVARAIGRVR